jgi:hypothetical protein
MMLFLKFCMWMSSPPSSNLGLLRGKEICFILKLAWSRGMGVLGELGVSHSIMSSRGLVNQANCFAIFLQLHGRRETPELGSRQAGMVLFWFPWTPEEDVTNVWQMLAAQSSKCAGFISIE